MPEGPFTRIVIRRRSGQTDIIGRRGHIDVRQVREMFARHGEIIAVRHEMMPPKGAPYVVAIHNLVKNS